MVTVVDALLIAVLNAVLDAVLNASHDYSPWEHSPGPLPPPDIEIVVQRRSER